MKRIVRGVATAAVVTSLLGGCAAEEEADPQGGGTSRTESYCVELEQQVAIISRFDQAEPPTAEQLDQAFTAFGTLAGQAPPELEQEWARIDDAFGTLQQALDDAGLDLEDFAALQRGAMPEEPTAGALDEVARAVRGIDADRLGSAFEAVDEHADSVCAVDLTGGGG